MVNRLLFQEGVWTLSKDDAVRVYLCIGSALDLKDQEGNVSGCFRST